MNQRILPEHGRIGLVTYTLMVNGEKIGLAHPVLSIEIFREVNRVPWAEIYFRDGDAAKSDFPLSEKAFFTPGNEVEIFGGYNLQESRIFKGIITGISIQSRQNRPSVLVVKASDPTLKMALTPHSAVYYEISEADLFSQLIKNHGLSPEVESAGIDSVQKEIVQFYATDWDFLVSRAGANGKVVVVEDGKVMVHRPRLEQPPLVSLLYGATIFDLKAELDARHQYEKVVARAWNSGDQEVIEVEKALPRVDREQGNIRSRDLAGRLSAGTLPLQHSGQRSARELNNWAEQWAARSMLAKSTGSVKFQGFPDIMPGKTIELQGVGDRFNGRAFVSAIAHQFGDGNWWTTAGFGMDFEPLHRCRPFSAPRASGLIPAVSGLQIGRVTQLQDDPDGQFRVRVNVPLIDEQGEGIWTRVATLDAGDQRGSFFRPELGDEVVIGFINDDPRDPILLGGLHSSSKTAPLTPQDANYHKGFVTRSAMRLIWDDEKKSVSLETPAGNVLKLDEDTQSITLSDQHRNRITMDKNGIHLNSKKDIDLEAKSDISLDGVNISHAATGKFKAEANTDATLKSNLSTIIKGTPVKIN